MRNPEREGNPVCKLADDTGGNESQSERIVRRGKYFGNTDAIWHPCGEYVYKPRKDTDLVT